MTKCSFCLSKRCSFPICMNSFPILFTYVISLPNPFWANSCLFSISFLCWPRNPVIQASCKSVPPHPAAIALNFTHLSCTIVKLRSCTSWPWISLFLFNTPQSHHQQVTFILTICKEAYIFKFLTIRHVVHTDATAQYQGWALLRTCNKS